MCLGTLLTESWGLFTLRVRVHIIPAGTVIGLCEETGEEMRG
jgi:hypothetical protein